MKWITRETFMRILYAIVLIVALRDFRIGLPEFAPTCIAIVWAIFGIWSSLMIEEDRDFDKADTLFMVFGILSIALMENIHAPHWVAGIIFVLIIMVLLCLGRTLKVQNGFRNETMARHLYMMAGLFLVGGLAVALVLDALYARSSFEEEMMIAIVAIGVWAVALPVADTPQTAKDY